MEELFFNKSLTSGLTLLGQGDKQFVFQKKMFVFFCTNIFFDEQNGLIILATIVNLPNLARPQ